MIRRALIPLGLLVAAISIATAADVPGIVLDGRVDHPTILTSQDLAGLPRTEIDVSFETAHGPMSGHYSGVLLWDLIVKAEIKPDPDKRKHHLQDTILVSGRDGYTVALSLAEIDPSFEGKQVIIGTETGAADPKPLRLIVPNDKMGGRDVRDVAHIEVR